MIKWAGICMFSLTLVAQPQPLNQFEVSLDQDTGWISNRSSQRAVVYSDLIEIPNASWIRLFFSEAILGASENDGLGTRIKFTSLLDGAVQEMNMDQLIKWRLSSAYFNGDAVLVEVIADSSSEPSRLMLEYAYVGENVDRSICGPTDDRVLSSDPRNGRIVPIGCTGWLINDANHCFLTAGHCTASGFEVVEFNVPLSTVGGTIQHPGPEDQYPIDPASVQSNGGQGIGNDWAYFGTFENTVTNMTAFQVQGSAYNLIDPPAVAGNITITGYGTTDGVTAPLEWNQVQKTHTGPFTGHAGFSLQYATDTTGGNSGSPIFHDESNAAIGIHTHAGCNSGGGENNGTASDHPDLVNALANPIGVCRPIAFNFPNGLPEFLPETGGVIRVEVIGQGEGVPSPTTGLLHYDLGDGGGVQSVAMSEITPNVYDAIVPGTDCSNIVLLNFSAEATTNVEFFAFPQVALDWYGSAVFDVNFASFADNFETDTGWTVTGDATDGMWERAVPVGGGLRGDPVTDADGSGFCFLTDNVAGNSDVDGGTTTLTSPIMNATGSGDNAHLVYWRWYSSDVGTQDDIYTIELSNDAGGAWTTIETLGPTGPETHGRWVHQVIRIADYFSPTNQMQVRFNAIDTGTGSVVEAAVDGVYITHCNFVPCQGDLNTDGTVDDLDLALMLSVWGTADLAADLDSNGVIDMIDLVSLMQLYGPCI